MAKKVTAKKSKSSWVGRKYGFKSGLEESVSTQIESKGIKVYSLDIDGNLRHKISNVIFKVPRSIGFKEKEAGKRGKSAELFVKKL